MLLPLSQIHLFDIDIPGKITFKESDSLTPREGICVVDAGEYLKLLIFWQRC